MTRHVLWFAPLTAALLAACGSSKGNCTPTNCAGCCDEQAFCQLNFTASACGFGGARCARCSTGDTCAQGVCTPYGMGGGRGGGAGGGSGGSGGGSPDGGKDAGGDGGASDGGDSGFVDSGTVDAGPTRFSVIAASWPVPPSGLADGFVFPKVTLSIRVWDTLDLDGDGRPDLIQTATPATGQVWTSAASGAAYWRVFLNTGTGFGNVIQWPVPASGLADGFFATSAATTTRQWATFDIDGDNRPDLVQTANPATGQVWAGPAWRVFKNTGAGFSPISTNWPVPVAPALGLPDGYNARDSAASPKAWSTLALDGDNLPDLVLTSSGGIVFGQGVNPHWRVHKNLGTGFSTTFTTWPVPVSGLNDGFTMPNSALSPRQWTTVDLDGDGLADLVHTANTTTNAVFAAGSPFWRFYKNLGTGFATTVTQWPVPPNGLADGFYATALQATLRRWATIDLTGDGRPELVQTANPANSQVWGTDAGVYWNVYRNTGAAFATTPIAWTVPFSGLPEGFFTHVSNASLNRWMAFDLNGDGEVELVHTATPTNDTVWTSATGLPIWKLYRAEP